jgi:hypothetical protein
MKKKILRYRSYLIPALQTSIAMRRMPWWEMLLKEDRPQLEDFFAALLLRDRNKRAAMLLQPIT